MKSLLFFITLLSLTFLSPVALAAAGYCNITSTQSSSLKSTDELRYPFMKLAFKQTSGMVIKAIAQALPQELSKGMTIPIEQFCVYDYVQDLESYLNLIILPQQIERPSRTAANVIPLTTDDDTDNDNNNNEQNFQQIQNSRNLDQNETMHLDALLNTISLSGTMIRLDSSTATPDIISRDLWTAIQTPSSWVYTPSYPVSRNIAAADSVKSTSTFAMKYCKTYNSLQDQSLDCPDDPSADDKKAHNKAKTGLAIGLAFASLCLGAVCVALFLWLYQIYEREADLKQAENIKKMKQLKAQRLKTPQQAADEVHYENQPQFEFKTSQRDDGPVAYPR